jgi:bifunctional non-homologous end joining protein LigD
VTGAGRPRGAASGFGSAEEQGDQLTLSIDEGGTGGTQLRLQPMIPSEGHGPFDDPQYLFEPWWPGSRAFLAVDRDSMRLRGEHLADPLEVFPELATIADQARGLPLILEGTLLVLDHDGQPDAELLRRRLEGHEAEAGQPAFVATDLLGAGGRALTSRPLVERRDRLETLLPDGEWCVVGRAWPEEGQAVAEALGSMGLAWMSARRLDGRYRPGPAGDDWLRVPVVPSEPPSRRPILALIQRLPLG